MKFKFLKAFNGDCIFVSFKDQDNKRRNILIDGGISWTYLRKDKKGKHEYGDLKLLIDNLKARKEKIDLLIITHIDDDHIGGILEWLSHDNDAHTMVKNVWFNSGHLISTTFKKEINPDLDHIIFNDTSTLTSLPQGIKFSQYLLKNNLQPNELIIARNTINAYGATFKILSPTKDKLLKLLENWKKKDPSLQTSPKKDDYSKSLQEHINSDSFVEDKAYPNGSSIAFILSYDDINYLLLGDSHPSVILESLDFFGYNENNKIDAKFVKLSHHGSKGNSSVELINSIKTDNYIISSNGRDNFHPHKQLLARIISRNPTCRLSFNYGEKPEEIFSEKDRMDFPYFTTEILTTETNEERYN